MDFNEIKNIIKLSQNENLLGPSPKACKAILENSIKMFQYPEPHSATLQSKIASKYQVEAKNVFVCAGLTEALDILIRNFIDKSENIIIPKLSFVAYKLLAKVFGIEVRFSEMEDYKIDVNSILNQYNNNTKAILIASPNNPTGTVFSETDLLKLLDHISPNTYLVLDEAYGEYATRESYPNALAIQKKYPNLIVMRTFSKIYGLAGLRVGYAIANSEIIEKFEYFQAPFTVNQMASVAAMAAIDDEDYVAESSFINKKERDILFSELTKLGYNIVPSESNFLFLHFHTQNERDRISDSLNSKGVIVRNMDAFGDEKALRISVGRPEMNKTVLNYLKTDLINA